MSFDRASVQEALVQNGPVIRVVVAKVEGSAPREAGASMLVWAGGQQGTIGGGELEWQAIHRARKMLVDNTKQFLDRVPLGPMLGQCCGGSVVLFSELFTNNILKIVTNNLNPSDVFARPTHTQNNMPLSVKRLLSDARNQGISPSPCLVDGWMIEPAQATPAPLWIYGAGHVGRALVNVFDRLSDFQITWVDTDANRFPQDIPDGVTMLVAAQPQSVVHRAPQQAHHLILTYSHTLDLELCHAVLHHGFASAGLIGSATKWMRFQRRLMALGHAQNQIDQIACPIGDKSLGKRPEALALGVATELLKTVAKTETNVKNNTKNTDGEMLNGEGRQYRA